MTQQKVRIFYSLANTSIPAPNQTLTTTTVKMAKSPILRVINWQALRQTVNSAATPAPNGTFELSLRLHVSSLTTALCVFPCSNLSKGGAREKLPPNTCDFC